MKNNLISGLILICLFQVACSVENPAEMKPDVNSDNGKVEQIGIVSSFDENEAETVCNLSQAAYNLWVETPIWEFFSDSVEIFFGMTSLTQQQQSRLTTLMAEGWENMLSSNEDLDNAMDAVIQLNLDRADLVSYITSCEIITSRSCWFCSQRGCEYAVYGMVYFTIFMNPAGAIGSMIASDIMCDDDLH